MLDHPAQFAFALFAGLLGFGGITGVAAQAAQFAFVAAVALLLVSLLRDWKRRRTTSRLQAWRQTRWTRYRT
jgi:uncharacterized membrane protein YtjA (UPF0391 family)